MVHLTTASTHTMVGGDFMVVGRTTITETAAT